MMNRVTRGAALSLAACGPVLFAGLAIHPHAPDAQNMAEVAYIQTEQVEWWPAHVLLLAGYFLFAASLVGFSRGGEIPPTLRRVLRVTVPVAWVCFVAMVAHLLLPLGRDSVANSHEGWAFWVKDVVESIDGVWALCVVAVAWSLARAGLAGGWLVGWLGVVGSVLTAAFFFAIPLTGAVLPVDVMKSLVPGLPMVGGILLTAWTVVAGLTLLKAPQTGQLGLRAEAGQALGGPGS